MNIVLNVLLIPPYGMMGAAVATLVAYVVLFVGMWYAQAVYPVAYQWRRVITLAGVAAGLTALGASLGSRSRVAILLPPLSARPAAARLLPAAEARLRRLIPLLR